MYHKIAKKVYNKDFGILLIRLGLGIAFISHGWQKAENIPGTIGFFFTLGLPAFMAYVIAAIELIGGIAMILGVCVRVFGFLLAIDMIGAITLVSSKMVSVRGFSAFELEFVLMMISLGMAFLGSGAYSFMSKKCDNCSVCKGGVCTNHEVK